MTIRVLLVDDQTLTRKGLRMVLQSERDIEIVGEAKNGSDALEKAIALNPEVVLIDLPMPNGDAIETTRAIKEGCPGTQILILCTSVDLAFFHTTAAAGAGGYVLKDITPADLAHAIRAVHNGMVMIMPAIVKEIVDVLTRGNHTSPPKATEQPRRLTGREIEVLASIAQGLSDKEIASKLFMSESTVKTHLRTIYHRLNVRNRAQAAAFAVENDLLPRFK